MKKWFSPLTAVLVFVFLPCCQNLTVEEEIHAYISTAAKRAESKDISALKKLISTEYTDRDRRTKQQVVRILAGYLLRNEPQNILLKIGSLHITDEPVMANVTVFAAISPEPLETDDIRLTQATIHKLTLQLHKENNNWRLVTAEWRMASADDFLAL